MFPALFASTLLLFSPVSSMRRLYVDPATGVSFRYPASWLLNDDDDAATAKLRIAAYGQPVAVVQLEGSFADDGPYKDTDFEAGAFAYAVTADSTKASCFDRIEGLAQGGGKAATVSQQAAREVRFSGMIAGTEDLHHATAVFRQGQCLLFESVLIRRDPDTGAKPLSPQSWQGIENAFDAVLGSVHLRTATPK